jgi:hypothetical protein
VDDTFGKTISIRTIFVVTETDKQQVAACGELIPWQEIYDFSLMDGH